MAVLAGLEEGHLRTLEARPGALQGNLALGEDWTGRNFRLEDRLGDLGESRTSKNYLEDCLSHQRDLADQ